MKTAEIEKLAQYIQRHMFEAHRGAFALPNGLLVAFGNDGYCKDNRSKCEVANLRAGFNRLRAMDLPVRELGFGTSHDGYSWAMAIKPLKKIGKRKLEIVVQMLNALLVAGWSGSEEIDHTTTVQFHIAQGVIAKHLAA